jgi:hypothetical protein
MPTLDFSETPNRGKATPRKSLKLVLGIGVISGVFALSSTLAASINLNSGGNVEFGQGVAQTTACSNGQSLIVTPLSSFTNTAGAGAFNFTGVTVSAIPESCDGVDFKISAYNATGDALPIFNTDSTVASVWNNNGSFQAGTGTPGVDIESTTGSFTINFTTPAALATNVARVTLQSTKHANYNCVTDLVCQVGDTGPGGGTVFYVNDSGFNCGPDHTATGSPTGGKCNYLEVAPYSAETGGRFVPEPAVPVGASIPNLPIESSAVNSTSALGLGYKYTRIIMANGYTSGEVFKTVMYRGGGKSDWYVPHLTEINQLNKYAQGQPWVSDATVATIPNRNNSGELDDQLTVLSLGFEINTRYWTSSTEGFGNQRAQNFGSGDQGAVNYDEGWRTRPIRAF